MDTKTVYTYVVDAEDRIRSVDENWRRFAIENGAPDLPDRAIGESLYRFFADASVVELYRTLAEGVRKNGRRLIVPFRCDSEERIRIMELEMTLVDDGAIRYSGVLLEEFQRPKIPARATSGRLPRCSVCLFVQVEEEWVSSSDLAFALDTSEWTVCPTCIEALGQTDL